MRIITAFLINLLVFSSLAMAQGGRQLTREGRQTSAKRTALVIGNGAYKNVSPLDNPVNDANDMAAALRNLGFEVIIGTDVGLTQMRRLIREFGEKLEASKGVGLVFYAGHGVEVRGKNFLVPVDAEIAREVETEDYAIDMNSVLRQMDAAGNGFNIVILDACRNNPFSRGWNRSGDTGGLATVLAPTGTYIAYAAAPGSTASDGKGTRNGTFTGALLKNLKRPNLKLEEVLKATREEVMAATGNKQVPWDSSSVQGDFYFVRAEVKPGPAKTDTPIVNETVTAKDAAAVEREAWSYIKNSADPQDFRDFLKDFPAGVNAANAKVRLEQAVWDLVKDSSDKARIQAYLSEFPSGANLPLARIKLRQIEATASTRKLTYPEVITALSTKLPNKAFSNKDDLINWLISQIKLRRVDKPLPESRENDLRQAGATNELIEAIRANSPGGNANENERANTSGITAGTTRKTPSGIDLVYIPPGDMMGLSEAEIDEAKKYNDITERSSFSDEMPKHKVTLREGFWMGKYEVTQGQWQAVMGDNPSKFVDCGANCPVEQVSWDDIQIFLKRLNAKNDGFEYSLPSEAQWEYAARAGTTTAFAFGDSLNSSQANFNGNYPYASTKGVNIGKTVAVGRYQPNAWGLYDMHGNVWELVQDIYNSSYNTLPTDGSANLSVGNSSLRVVRGGSWYNLGNGSRSAHRDVVVPTRRNELIGFRVDGRAK